MNRSSRALAVASGGTFLSFLDATVANLALPDLAADFDVGVAALSWAVTAYAIPFAALLAPAGALADAWGRARLFLVGVGLFTVASAMVAVAPAYEIVLGGRALQGVGAALLVPASLGLVLAEVPAERRAAAIGVWSAAGAAAAAAGPALGGVLVELVDWRALFCLNLPIGAFLYLRARELAVGESREGRVPDLLGSVLLALSVGGAVYAVTEGSERGWSDGWVLAGFTVALVAGVAALARAARHPRPAFAVRLWRSRPYAAATAASTLYGAGLYSTMLLGVLFLVRVWHYDELRAGLAMTPAAVVTAVTAIGIGRLPTKPSPRALVAAGFAALAVANGVVALVLPAEPQFLTLWLPLGALLGIGTGLTTVGISSAATLSVAPQHFATGIGLVMAARQVGGALGVALLAAILASRPGTDVTAPYAAVYWAACALTAAGAATAVWLRLSPAPAAAAVTATAALSER